MNACPPDGAAPAAKYVYVDTVITWPTFAVVPATGDCDETLPTNAKLEVNCPAPPSEIVYWLVLEGTDPPTKLGTIKVCIGAALAVVELE